MSQKHYTTVSEIVAVIDEAMLQRTATEKEALLHLKLADHYNRKASTMSNGDATWCLAQCDEEMRKHDFLIRRAERIEKKLGQLKRTLAAFQTQDMFGEPSTVLQP